MRRGAVLGLVIVVLFAGVSLAFFVAHQIKINKMTVGDNVTEIEENWSPPSSFEAGATYTKMVRVKNTGSVPCYVRVFADVKAPDMRSAVEIDFDYRYWTKKNDGYYYYSQILEPGEKTEYLFKHIQALADLSDFELIVYEESVQAGGFGSADEAFAYIR